MREIDGDLGRNKSTDLIKQYQQLQFRPPLPPVKKPEKPKKSDSLPKDALTPNSAPEDTGVYKMDRSAMLRKTAEADSTEAAASAAPPPKSEPVLADGVAPSGISVEVLKPITEEAMTSRGLVTGFPPEVIREVKALGGPAPLTGEGVRDLRDLQWASIDNADTRDIDQLAFVEDLGDGRKRMLVAIADVAESMPKNQALDKHAQKNTSTIYAPGNVQPLLPREMATDWTSLNPDVDRRAMVTEMIIGADGKVEKSDVFEAAVHNRAKLDYVSLSKWYEDGEPVPGPLQGNPEMQKQARLQIEAGQQLGKAAAERGALAFETERVFPDVEDGRVTGLKVEKKNVANEAVANMMIASNVANTRYLRDKGFPVMERALVTPQRWEKMRKVAVEAASSLPEGSEMAAELSMLPPNADPAALSGFLKEYKRVDPKGYPDTSLSMLKLMGGSDYMVTGPDEPLKGHFGQGIVNGEDGYVHSTAPNRRYPDVITQRLLKAAVRGEPCPYTRAELEDLAYICNDRESAAKGAQRQVTKAAIAHYLQTQVGQEYDAAVTGARRKGTFVKLAEVPVEGKITLNQGEADVGDKVRVKLTSVNLKKGHVNFERLDSDIADSEPAQGGPLLAF